MLAFLVWGGVRPKTVAGEAVKHCWAILGLLLAMGKACACAPSFEPVW